MSNEKNTCFRRVEAVRCSEGFGGHLISKPLLDYKGQVLNRICKLVGFTHLGNQFEIADTITDRHFQLMRVYHPMKGNTLALALCGFRK